MLFGLIFPRAQHASTLDISAERNVWLQRATIGSAIVCDRLRSSAIMWKQLSLGWFSYNRRYRFDRPWSYEWSYDWGDYMRTLHKRSLMHAAIGATAIAWIARVLSGRLVADRGDRSDAAII